MARIKAGLHKDVSTIFNGVEIPRNNATEQSAADSQSSAEKQTCPSHLTPTHPKQEQNSRKSRKIADDLSSSLKNGRLIASRRMSKMFSQKSNTNSTKQKTMTLLVPILFIVFIFVFIQSFSNSSPKIIHAEQMIPLKPIPVTDRKNVWKIPEPYPDLIRDPMQFVSTDTHDNEMSSIIINGIVFSEDNPAAVINNKIVHVGDKVFNTTIVKINEGSVEFEKAGKTWEQKVRY